jgi:cation diffusion facilitator CzcD-associated flavoprotein CzcO
MRVAIIGAGISGIAFAGVFRRFCHECVLFEKADSIGGIWALAYPQVRLQNSREQYTFVDFPWPEQPDQHPTAIQILDYLDAVVKHFELDVRLRHAVTAMIETDAGWTLTVDHNGEEESHEFDYVIVSIGQYSEQKYRPEFSGEAEFAGDVITERDVKSLDIFRDKNVAVVGFGKSAVDMVSFTAPIARSVAHVFRTPRWLVPFRLLGMHYTYLFFARATTMFMPSWVHAGRAERALHHYVPGFIVGFWKAIGLIVTKHIQGHAIRGDFAASERLTTVIPAHDFAPDLRSATAMAPVDYYAMIADGRIQPHHAGIKGFGAHSLQLMNGEELKADVVVLSVGSGTPVFPFMPQHYREMIENETDGVQLYRHILHPQIKRLGFAGYNHGFMHVPAAEISALWLCAVLRGDIELPSAEAQEESINTIRNWKREHIQYEPSRSCAVSTRFQQYIDALLIELGVSPYRKMPNPIAECFARYGGADYAGVVAEVHDHPPPPHAVREYDA